jgi:alpha-L-rhamnosidase
MRVSRPVWPMHLTHTQNTLVGFRTVFTMPRKGHALLRVAAADAYRLFVDGKFLMCGPARCAHGSARVDEIPLQGLSGGRHLLAFEVAGYYVPNYQYIRQPAFLQAELLINGTIVAATHPTRGEFAAVDLAALKPPRVQRFSVQRTFVETWVLGPDSDAWRRDLSVERPSVPLVEIPPPTLLARGVPWPDLALRVPRRVVSEGRLRKVALPKKHWEPWVLRNRGPWNPVLSPEQLHGVLSHDLQRVAVASRIAVDRDAQKPLGLAALRFAVADFGVNRTGFMRLRVVCRGPCRLVATFDELIDNGVVNWHRLGAVCAADWSFTAAGVYEVESLEPYSLRYLQLQTLRGACRIERVELRELAHGQGRRALFECSDPALRKVFDAAVETFRQNAVDIFMDCPSRERAGWLCDSFFTARVEPYLTGGSAVERNFLEHFAVSTQYPNLPAGMWPMCYSADHVDGRYIPNWALWGVLELEEYVGRSGDRAMAEALRPRVCTLLDFLRQYRNREGLLEKLDSWVFVEWSKANEFLQDVSFPSNALWAGALDAAARLYRRPEWGAEAERVRAAIRKFAWDGAFFCDNALRQAGRLVRTGNRTETCQYYMFFFDVASAQKDRGLWDRMVTEFGPKRDAKTWPDVHASNAFIGAYLRMELLARHGLQGKLREELVDFLLPMAERTGTLWEHLSPSASCNHGFASHAAVWILRDLAGVKDIDPVRRRIIVQPTVWGLDACDVTIPLGDKSMRLRWKRRGDHVCIECLDLPKGWTALKGPKGPARRGPRT